MHSILSISIRNPGALAHMHVINLSFEQGVVPAELRIARVVPIHKVKDELEIACVCFIMYFKDIGEIDVHV